MSREPLFCTGGRRELHVVSEIVSLAIGVDAGLLFHFRFSGLLDKLVGPRLFYAPLTARDVFVPQQ
jgi:hypothetical protein